MDMSCIEEAIVSSEVPLQRSADIGACLDLTAMYERLFSSYGDVSVALVLLL